MPYPGTEPQSTDSKGNIVWHENERGVVSALWRAGFGTKPQLLILKDLRPHVEKALWHGPRVLARPNPPGFSAPCVLEFPPYVDLR